MEIKKAIITNYKGIKHAEIPFTNHMILLQGKNGSGKSSLIDGILSCLSGKDENVKEPIRLGEKRSENTIEFEDGKIVRTFTPKGTEIKMLFNDGKQIRGIKKIAEYVGCSSFDPMEFSNMNEKEQRELILKISGVDLTEANNKIKEAEEKRLELGRIERVIHPVSNTEAQEVQGYEDKEEVSVVELSKKLEEANQVIADYENYKSNLQQLENKKDNIKHQIEELQKELKLLEDIAIPHKPEPVDERAEIKKQMEGAEETNRKIRKAKELAKRNEDRIAAVKTYKAQDEVVKQAREAKQAMLANTKMPVKGLTVDDDGVKFNGVPFKQVNTAEQIITGVKIALQDPNNKLKFVFIEKGSELDSDSIAKLQELVDMCREKAGLNVNIVIGQAKDEPQENGFFLEEGELIK